MRVVLPFNTSTYQRSNDCVEDLFFWKQHQYVSNQDAVRVFSTILPVLFDAGIMVLWSQIIHVFTVMNRWICVAVYSRIFFKNTVPGCFCFWCMQSAIAPYFPIMDPKVGEDGIVATHSGWAYSTPAASAVYEFINPNIVDTPHTFRRVRSNCGWGSFAKLYCCSTSPISFVCLRFRYCEKGILRHISITKLRLVEICR